MISRLCLLFLINLGGYLGPSIQASAQTFPIFGTDVKIAVLDQEQLFLSSDAGLSIRQDFEEQSRALAAENDRIQKELEEEELKLTEIRKTLPSEEFAILADEFDTKVRTIRNGQSQKERDLNLGLTNQRSQFFQKATPVLLQLINDLGIEVVLNKETVVLAAEGTDITLAAIQRVNELIKE